MRNGPPIIAIIVEAGTSIGLNIVRPRVSANNIINAPNSAVKGISTLWSYPTSRRAICGTNIPTNEITPATTTDAAANRTATAAITILAAVTLNPTLFAVLSDRTRTLQEAYKIIAKISPMDPYVTINDTSSQVLNDKLDVIDPDAEAPKLIIASVRPENIALIAMPTNINFNGFNPDFHESKKTKKQASAPPINAAIGVKKNSVGTKLTINSFVNAAPAEIPINPASANGFLIIACSNTPATDNAAPANNATIIRGKRKSLMAAISALPALKKFVIKSINDIWILPVVAA